MNLSSILNSTLKVLNIADKTIPLIKDINPSIKNVKDKIRKFKGLNINPKENKHSIVNTSRNTNNPTFFK